MPGIDRHTELWISFDINLDGEPSNVFDSSIAADIGGPVIHNFNSEPLTRHSAVSAVNGGNKYTYDFNSSINDVLTLVLAGITPIIFKPYTIDFWLNFTHVSSNGWNVTDVTVLWQIGPNGDYLKIWYDASANQMKFETFIKGVPTTKTISTVFSTAPTAWVHWAFDYDGERTFRFYLNGVRNATIINFTESQWFENKLSLGSINTGGFVSLMLFSNPSGQDTIISLDEIRFSNIRRWANWPHFDPPNLPSSVEPDEGNQDGDEAVYLNFDSYPFVDSIPTNPGTVVETGSPTQETDLVFHNVGSMNLDGNSYITITPDAALQAQYNRRIEPSQELSDTVWIYVPSATPSGTYTIFSYFENVNNRYEVEMTVAGSFVSFKPVYRGNGNNNISTLLLSTDISDFKFDAWHKITLKKNVQNPVVGQNIVLFYNGVVHKYYELNNFGASVNAKLRIGANYNGGKKFKGKVDLFRGTNNAILTDHYYQNHYVPRFNQNTHLVGTFNIELVPNPSILSGAIPSNIPDFALAANSLYIAGIEPMVRITSDELLFPAGLANPLQPTLQTDGAGNLTGDYDYVITFIDNEGNESGPSPVTSTLTVSAKKIKVTIPIPITQGAFGVKQVNIYRRKTSIGETEHFLVDTIRYPVKKVIPPLTDTSSSYIDNVDDDSVSKIIVAPLQSVGPPPASNFVEWNDAISRMFYGFVKIQQADNSFKTFSTRLYMSDVNAPHRVSEDNFILVGSDDSDPITGLKVLEGSLIVFKERSIHQVIGNDLASISRVKTSPEVGCVSNLTIAEIDKALLFMSDNGVYAFDGNNVRLISDALSPIFKNMPSTRKPYARGVYCEDEGLYILSISRTDTTKNDTLLVYHYNEFLETGKHKWTVWPIDEQIIEEAILGSARTVQIHTVNSESRISKFQGTLDFGQPFTAEWVGPSLSPLRSRRQHLRYLKFIIDYNSAGSTDFNVGYQINGTQTLTNITSSTQEELLVSVNRRQYFIAPVIKFNQPVIIVGYNFDTKVIGFR